MRTVRARARAGVAAAAVGVAAGVALWLSDSAPKWLSAALTTVITAVLLQEITRRQRRIRVGDPFDVHVKISDADYVLLPAVSGEPQRTVPASGHTVRLHVTVPERTVALVDLRAVVLQRRPPRGELTPHAGVMPVRAYTVLLDEDPPRLQPNGPDTPVTFSYKIGPDDPETFALRPETARWLVTWVLELDWVCDRRSGTTRVDLAGHPFRTVARPPRGLSWEYEP